MSDERKQRGEATRRRVLGDDYVNARAKETSAFQADFQGLLTEFCWGSVWQGEAISPKQRSLITVAMVAVMNRHAEFKTHIRGAVNNGCSVDEIKETLLQVAAYAGMPAGVEAFRLASEVLKELELIET